MLLRSQKGINTIDKINDTGINVATWIYFKKYNNEEEKQDTSYIKFESMQNNAFYYTLKK